MSPIRNGLAALVPIVLGIGHAAAADLPDLAKIDRTIRKEPTYTTKRPLYGLAVFGPKAEARVWIVLDKSKPDAEDYDVLHIDLNAEGRKRGRESLQNSLCPSFNYPRVAASLARAW